MAGSSELIVSISGIRGLVGESLTEDVVRRFAAAFGTTLEAGGSVVVARDTRPSGEELASQVAQALQETGMEVLDLGVCATPTAKLMVTEWDAQGAIIVTASHNPLPWNGLKLIRADGIFLNGEQGEKVEELFASGHFRHRAGGSIRTLDGEEVQERHLRRLLGRIDAAAIRRAGLKVALDPCNGTGGLLIPALLRELGVDAAVINGEPHGRFAHEPEPLPANLVQLGEAVRQHGCAVGFAVDPDADRVALVDEKGKPLGEDYTLALAVDLVTEEKQGTVVTTLSTSQTVTDAAVAHGCAVELTAVGEVHVVEKMLETQAVVGGEGNGGVILIEVDPGRDAAVGVALVLEALARRQRPLGQLIGDLPLYYMEKRKVTCTAQRLQETIAWLHGQYPKAYVHPVQDGSKLYLNGRLECPWIHLRASNTEPVVRIIVESANVDQAHRVGEEVERFIAQG
ncbi:MAG: phosphoglucosamine mutase [Candidatus Latescibacteria bacterium]|nr:phosphoglucosamine mutase [Candidatus Latescibacterota bacterium]